MFDFVGKRLWFFLFSALVIVCGVVFMIVLGLPVGNDFTGGTQITVLFDATVSQEQIETELAKIGDYEPMFQPVEKEGKTGFIIKIAELGDEEETKILEAIKALGAAEEPNAEFISGTIARERARGAVIAVVIAAIGILLYISWAFRKLPKPFRYGTCAIIALVHDVLVVVAVFAILGKVLNLEVNLLFITGLLTVIGYSVNDTIVVFDRLRENLLKDHRQSFETVVNNSLVETLSRSLNTGLTTLIVMVAVYLFVGDAIRSFVLVLIVGAIAGTYSSIFIASQFLVVWETKKLRGTGQPRSV